MVTFLNGVDHRSKERKIGRAPIILGKQRNSARSENLYGTPYCRARGVLALFDGAKQSGQADVRRVRTGLSSASSSSLPTLQPERFHRFRNFELPVLFRYLWRLTLSAAFVIFT